jgi:hypothetical protein
MAGISLVSTFLFLGICDGNVNFNTTHPGNYDVTKLHYDGPGEVPGAVAGGYGYDVRTQIAPTA